MALTGEQVLAQVVSVLLESHFPPSLHDELCAAVGLQLQLRLMDQARRDPEFRLEVLRADGGPDAVDNGVALCVLHHRALDRGVVGISPDCRVLVSRRFHGSGRARELVIDLAGRPIHPPQLGLPLPAAADVAWHGREVFSGEARTPAGELRAAEDRGTFDG